MHFSIFLALDLALTAGLVRGGDSHPYKKPGPHDRRSPCPMLNSLANHGFLARNGLNISIDEMVNGLAEAINLAPDSSRPVAETAATTSTTGNPNTMNLDDLRKHGVIEHDGSLSRNDVYLGDNLSFNATIFATVAAHFTGKTISIQTAAKARTDRIAAARAANPTFNFTAREDQFSLFESALYQRVFGKGTEGNARTNWVRVMFCEERLPYQEGFKRSEAVLQNSEIVELADKLRNASDVPL